MSNLAIIITVYNEEGTIREVVTSLSRQYHGVDKTFCIVVDDGSTDATREKIRDLDVIYVRHKKNQGLGRAFQSGLEKAMELKAHYVVNIDGDGQFNPQDVSKILSPLILGEADFVTASRFIDKRLTPPRMPLLRYMGNIVMSQCISFILKKKYYDVSCGFRAYSKNAILRMNLFGRFTYTQETFLDIGFKGLEIREVPVVVQYFVGRKSKMASSLLYYAWKSFKIIFRAVLNYKPLKFFGTLGALIFFLGCILNIILLVYYFSSGRLTPYKILGFTGAFLNILGIIIFIMGLIADMLYRIRMTQERILYYEKERRYYS